MFIQYIGYTNMGYKELKRNICYPEEKIKIYYKYLIAIM